MNKFWTIFFSILCGAIVGSINGFLGAGGGMLLVPMLQYILKIDNKKSHATAVFVILPISLISGLVYVLKSAVEWNIFIPVAIGTLAGGVAGTFLMKNLKSQAISFIFWIVMVASGVWIVVNNLMGK